MHHKSQLITHSYQEWTRREKETNPVPQNIYTRKQITPWPKHSRWPNRISLPCHQQGLRRINQGEGQQCNQSVTVLCRWGRHDSPTVELLRVLLSHHVEPVADGGILSHTKNSCHTLAMLATVRPHMLSSSHDSMSLPQKVKSGMGALTRMCQWLTSTIDNWGCTALDMPEWWEMTEQVHWWTKQPSQVACFLEDVKCWGAWDITCQHKVKNTTPSSIAWRREAWKEEALYDTDTLMEKYLLVLF